jgi:hypothetical protein
VTYSLIAIEGKPDPIVPFSFQKEFLSFMEGDTRDARAMMVWPRRHGKDLIALHKLLERAHDRVGMYWHGLPTYEQARKSCWTAFRNDTGQRLMDNVFPREVVRRPSEWAPAAEMLVELRNGSLIQFIGSDKIDALVGAGPLGVNCSEYALWKPTAFDFLRPMLRENHGWATFLFTPRGRNHAFRLYQMALENPEWFVSKKTIYTAGRYTKAEADALIAEERASGMLEEMIRQEYLTDFTAALVGSYWGDVLEKLEERGNLAPFEHERDGLHVTFDLGVSDSTALWVYRFTTNGVDFVAHYESHSQPISHYMDKLYEDWARNLSFKYVHIWLPHDARARTLTTGETVAEKVQQYIRERNYPTALSIVPQLSLLDGIQAGRRVLMGETRLHPRCDEHHGIEALRQYHREYDDVKRVFRYTPEHDWSSHTADAFRYAAVSMNIARRRHEPAPAEPLRRTYQATGVTMDEAWKTARRSVKVRRA